MSTDTVRLCDGCGDRLHEGDALWTVGVVVVLNAIPTTPFPSTFNRGMRATNNNRMVKDHWKDFCDVCMIAKGLKPLPEDEEPAKKPDTLDDLLREIVSEEVQAVMDEGGR